MTEQGFDGADQPQGFDLTDPGPGEEQSVEQTGESVSQEYDFSGDGLPDFAVQAMANGSYVAVSDDNGDRLADTFGLDLDGDGELELRVTRQGESYHVEVDGDGDGVFETVSDMTREELSTIDPQVVEALDHQFGQPSWDVSDAAAEDVSDFPESPFVADGQLVGDPVGDAEHWFEQAVNGFCVPASIAQIASEYTGNHYEDESYFVERANELRIFDVGPDGVPSITIDGALVLLEDAGVPASIEFGEGVETLVEYLDDGRSVLVAVDSGEVWYGEQTEDQQADHAIVVTGVDLDRGVVIVSDPGDPEGNAKEYPISQFEDAWADSGFTALVCDEPSVGLTSSADAWAEAGAEPTGGLPDALTQESSPLETAVEWTVRHSWAVLPVLLGARLVAGSRK